MNNIIFTHIPKTAGTTFRHIIDSNFSQDEIIRLSGRKSFITATRKKVFMGHIPYGIHRYRPLTKFDYITFLRNPIERTISHYFFVLQGIKHPNHEFHKNNSIEDILAYKGSYNNFGILRDNLQTRFLYGFEALKNKPINELELLNKAKYHLKYKYKTFGIQEKFKDSVEKMCFDLGLNYSEDLILERNKVTKIKKDFPEQTVNFIIEKNKLDIELYEYALKLKYR